MPSRPMGASTQWHTVYGSTPTCSLCAHVLMSTSLAKSDGFLRSLLRMVSKPSYSSSFLRPTMSWWAIKTLGVVYVSLVFGMHFIESHCDSLSSQKVSILFILRWFLMSNLVPAQFLPWAWTFFLQATSEALSPNAAPCLWIQVALTPSLHQFYSLILRNHHHRPF